jgi:hypothetical protein
MEEDGGGGGEDTTGGDAVEASESNAALLGVGVYGSLNETARKRTNPIQKMAM